MWFQKFLDIISRLFPVNPLSGVEEELAKLNPDKIYVEQVRSLLNVSHERALWICETATRQGVFSRHVEVYCPDGQAAASAPTESELPLTVMCWHEEDGDNEEIEMSTRELKKLTFYKLNDSESATYKQTA
jgi:hypothetical protein